MQPSLEIRILGPLDVLVNGQRIDIPAKQRELLAILAVHANGVVSTDQLIDALWGEQPPPTAQKTLQAHVSRLRRALEGIDLETRGGGYVLRTVEGQLDADVFASHLANGRRALADGAPDGAVEELQRGLALWRGAPLADVRYEAWAQVEIARLEELRLSAIEERIEAELSLGRHAGLVAELEALVADHPLRERLRGQLMLALYRSNRQAEALAVYQQGRRSLAEELGLEPSESLQSLERRMLERDPELEAPRKPSRPGPARRSRRALGAIAAGCLAVAGAAALIGLLLIPGGDGGVEAAGAAVLDPDAGSVETSVALGSAPSNVAVGEGSIWVLDADDRTVSRIDPASRAVERVFSTGSTPTDIALGEGALWVTNGSDAGGSLPLTVSRLDPETGVAVTTIDLVPARGGVETGNPPGSSRQHIAVTNDAVWVVNPNLTLTRIDPRTNRVVARVDDVQAGSVAAGDGQVWVREEEGGIAEIDPARNVVSRRFRVSADTLSGIAVGGGAVWVADPFAGTVWRVNTTPRLAGRAIDVKPWVAGLAFGEGALWATNEIADEVYRIDLQTNEPETITGLPAPRGVEAGDGAVWISHASPPSSEQAVSASSCGDVYFEGTGNPDVLLVSELPLKGATREWTQAMVDGFRFLLESRGFEAGGQSIGHQSCDSATAQVGSSDFYRCGTNAKAYARNLRVVGVFGAFDSPCSYAQIPITNEAPEGPLAMISPSNTAEFVTADETLYPTGERNYARIAAPEQLQGAALVELVAQLGKKRAFVLRSADNAYVDAFFETLEVAARRHGIEIVGSVAYEPDAKTFRSQVREVAASGADAVLIVGLLTPGAGALVRELRHALGAGVPLLAPDDFTLIDGLRALAGPAAQGMYISQWGIPNSHLPPAGKTLLRDLGVSSPASVLPDFAASYGAQGAAILLDAVARSDGSRASVTKELFRTNVRDGILGDIRFTGQGDLLVAPLTILRVKEDELVVDRVVTVPSTQPKS